MIIPQMVVIHGQSIPVIYAFVAAAFVCAVFVFWLEGRKDGFDDVKLFDFAFLCSGLASLLVFLIKTILSNLTLYVPQSPLLKVDPLYLYLISIVCVLVTVTYWLTRVWRWSIFRILDICAVTLNLFLLFVSIGLFLVYRASQIVPLLVLLPLVYVVLLRFRGYKFRSGFIFSAFLTVMALYLLVIYRKPGYLIFSPLLLTIGFVTYYFREKKNMIKRNLPLEFIENIRKSLTQKDKEIGKAQAVLQKEDPYMQTDRTVANSELMDEAILEDNRKELFDIHVNFLSLMRAQVRKALALIKIGKYGVCEVCGKPIDKARLKVFPEATVCIDCSREREYRK